MGNVTNIILKQDGSKVCSSNATLDVTSRTTLKNNNKGKGKTHPRAGHEVPEGE